MSDDMIQEQDIPIEEDILDEESDIYTEEDVPEEEPEGIIVEED